MGDNKSRSSVGTFVKTTRERYSHALAVLLQKSPLMHMNLSQINVSQILRRPGAKNKCFSLLPVTY